MPTRHAASEIRSVTVGLATKLGPAHGVSTAVTTAVCTAMAADLDRSEPARRGQAAPTYGQDRRRDRRVELGHPICAHRARFALSTLAGLRRDPGARKSVVAVQDANSCSNADFFASTSCRECPKPLGHVGGTGGASAGFNTILIAISMEC
jgi:hypothetical protein